MLKDKQFEAGNDEKAALRGYLQRAEVRLSTMHRIAGVFLNGAGILFLLPVFIKDVVLQILEFLLPDILAGQLTAFPHLLMLFSILAIPMWAFYLLIQDIVKFYFTAYHAGIRETFFHPRFILSGITFSDDESEALNQKIIEIEHSQAVRRFIVPENATDREYYRKVYQTTQGEIVPSTRRAYLNQVTDSVEHDDLSLFYTAFGLTGVIDRTLAEEAAKMEMSLVRHALNLRHLVLRYAKALLMFVFTTFLLLIFNLLIDVIGETHKLEVLSFAFAIWGVLTPFVVTQPLRWIYQTAEKRLGVTNLRSDHQLKTFERIVITISIATFGFGFYYTNAFSNSILGATWTLISIASTISLALYWYPKTFSEQSLITQNKKEGESPIPSKETGSNKKQEKSTIMSKTGKSQIFISYSNKDREWLDKFKTHLKVLERNKEFQVWDDTQIKSGTKWKEEITKALSEAKVALLLVTPDFLASDFIINNELPPLLKSAEKKGVTIFWVAVKPSLYDETDISDFQAANDPRTPLIGLSEVDIEKEITKICKKIKDAVNKK